MAQKTIQGNQVLARQIRSRRNELGLTIEEASSRAGVGTKTWCRYEAGESYSYRQMQRNLQSTEQDRFPVIRCRNL